MTIAVLLWPHANVRYFDSIRKISENELNIMLKTISPEIKVRPLEMCGLPLWAFDAPWSDRLKNLLSRVSCLYAAFEMQGESLRPLLSAGSLRFGSDLSGILKYKGKTNEMFTGMLINLAVFSSAFAGQFDHSLSLLDPMCGRGTSLFEGLRRDYDLSGIEIDKMDIGELNKFLKKYSEFNKLKHKIESTSMTVNGKPEGTKVKYILAENNTRWKENPRCITFVSGDTLFADKFYKGRQFHALVCDLPYGIQHESRDGQSKVSLDKMMEKALISWKKTLFPGAAAALSFNSNTLSLADARAMLKNAGYEPIVGEEYDHFEHWVEQAITRDIVVARFNG